MHEPPVFTSDTNEGEGNRAPVQTRFFKASCQKVNWPGDKPSTEVMRRKKWEDVSHEIPSVFWKIIKVTMLHQKYIQFLHELSDTMESWCRVLIGVNRHLILARNSLNWLHRIEPGNKLLSFLCSWLQFGGSHLASGLSSTEQGLLESSQTCSGFLLGAETGIPMHASCNWKEYKKRGMLLPKGIPLPQHMILENNPRSRSRFQSSSSLPSTDA